MPSVAVLSHDEQRDRLETYSPEAVEATLIAGDPCFDRILASRPLRETYRRRFHAHPQQRVVVVSSTWGEASLFGRHPSLVPRLARELPLDEYRILLALHPNIWHGHTPWQIRTWLADCARAGVVVLPPEEGWRAALVAADVTIGDHGSVTFYSAALGTPLLLASRPENTVDAASPIARLLRVAPGLDTHGDLARQLDSVVKQHHASRYFSITGLATSVPGESAELLRTAVYTRLGLDEPGTAPDTIAAPMPPVEHAPPCSQLVEVLMAERADALTVSATRLPAEALREPSHPPAEAVLVTSTEEPARRWLELAEILVRHERCEDAEHWIRTSLTELPGCLLAATRAEAGHWLVSGTDLPLVRFTGPGDLGPVYAAVVHAWLRNGRKIGELPGAIHIWLGRREETVHSAIVSAQD